tara:strand:- start:372 stop:563 length:192 start_codon:yes stop_codon:yes gene_type:complete
MAKKTRQTTAPTLVSKKTMAAKVQNVPYVSRLEEIQERIAEKNKVRAAAAKKEAAAAKKKKKK